MGLAAPRKRGRLQTGQRNGFVRLWVEDNGIGIGPRHLGKLFGLFQRLHPIEAYPGTGMGLAIIKKAAERMGGTVGVESEPGQGSRFWVELRQAPPPSPERAAESAKAPGRRMLIEQERTPGGR